MRRSCHRRKPRASGDDPENLTPDGGFQVVNPARAGMILTVGIAQWFGVRKPRASGDDPADAPPFSRARA